MAQPREEVHIMKSHYDNCNEHQDSMQQLTNKQKRSTKRNVGSAIKFNKFEIIHL